ncbi:hypothetical protein M378DRAFT_163849 [Amanita muscaria Koide BX008]|uniref:Uncharacterized protein n=1 Tax=Amanita muscaria (strain Koide BX008) TaxID=946122 RepID=A0A0C2X5A0_AMAMK|nr:hypothetical protein M378DRAFT_163849 [Amanita muscaria Koide BX008]
MLPVRIFWWMSINHDISIVYGTVAGGDVQIFNFSVERSFNSAFQIQFTIATGPPRADKTNNYIRHSNIPTSQHKYENEVDN